jgi:hypothetical protein
LDGDVCPFNWLLGAGEEVLNLKITLPMAAQIIGRSKEMYCDLTKRKPKKQKQ